MSKKQVSRIRLALILLGIVSGWMVVLFAEPFKVGSKAQGVMQSVIFRQGENGYTGCADTRISAENPNSNFGDAELILGGKGRVNIVIRFDVSSLPSNAIIHEATLSLKVVNYGQRPSDPVIMGTFAVTRAWEEMEATWYKATNADDWGLPGCNDVYSDRSADALDSQAIFELGWYSWDITSAAQHWVQDHASNKGVVIQQTNLEVGGEYDIRESEYGGQYVRPYLTVKYFLATPTPPATNTPVASPTATATQTATPTEIPTHTPSASPTATQTATPTEIPTTTPTRLPIVHRLYFPKVPKMFPMKCVQWGYTFKEEFENPALAGWAISLGGGQQQVSNSIIHLWTEPSIDRFPLLWRNGIFAGAGDDFLFEARFRHSDFTAYGTTIALNSASFDGNRISAGQSLPPGIEDMLNIHHVVDHTGGVFRFDITMFKDQPNAVVWSGTPGDSSWHVVRITLEQGNTYTLYVDDERIGTVKSTVRPSSVYIGNPTIQPFLGGWTQLYVDYIRISHCTAWGSH